MSTHVIFIDADGQQFMAWEVESGNLNVADRLGRLALAYKMQGLSAADLEHDIAPSPQADDEQNFLYFAEDVNVSADFTEIRVFLPFTIEPHDAAAAAEDEEE